MRAPAGNHISRSLSPPSGSEPMKKADDGNSGVSIRAVVWHARHDGGTLVPVKDDDDCWRFNPVRGQCASRRARHRSDGLRDQRKLWNRPRSIPERDVERLIWGTTL